jgi:hypothetical protein
MIKATRALLAATCALTVAGAEVPAMAQEAPSFGDAGVIVVSSDASFAIGATFYDDAEPPYASRDATFGLAIAPALDAFVARNLSIGGSTRFAFVSSGGSDSIAVNPSVRVGYLFRLAERFGLWPRAGIGYGLSTGEVSVLTADGRGGYEYTLHVLYAHGSAAFLVHAAPHFFMGVAPYGELEFFSEVDVGGTPPKQFSFGANLVLGGWW